MLVNNISKHIHIQQQQQLTCIFMLHFPYIMHKNKTTKNPHYSFGNILNFNHYIPNIIIHTHKHTQTHTFDIAYIISSPKSLKNKSNSQDLTIKNKIASKYLMTDLWMMFLYAICDM